MSDLPGWNPDSPALVTPMTLAALLSRLRDRFDAGEVAEDTVVYVAFQPANPYAYPVVDLVIDPPLPAEDWPGAVYLAVGRCAGRLDPDVRQELGWAADPPRESDPADPTTYGLAEVLALPAPDDRPTTKRTNRKARG